MLVPVCRYHPDLTETVHSQGQTEAELRSLSPVFKETKNMKSSEREEWKGADLQACRSAPSTVRWGETGETGSGQTQEPVPQLMTWLMWVDSDTPTNCLSLSSVCLSICLTVHITMDKGGVVCCSNKGPTRLLWQLWLCSRRAPGGNCTTHVATCWERVVASQLHSWRELFDSLLCSKTYSRNDKLLRA